MKRIAALCIMLGLLLFLLAGCGSKSEQPAGQQTQQAVENAVGSTDAQQQEIEDAAESADPEQQTVENTAENTGQEQQAADAQAIGENGSYTSREDVALYLHTYGKLPSNFITKKEAKSLGWEGGSLEPYAPGKCIGGDRFGNYEGALPDGSYHECDIGTLGKSSRGAKRIVYSDDGRIYYTDDHYETFEQLY